ncbi:hypothetical protein BG011_004563 [Mortierella polycephala]|uniref:Uncharacterized protein n=1 Tax=Mortierella polycephala TaxID=41804 RepID=A0A9P6QCG3_9FUNG|nr:hypothetical protein BG011_004563 [Mortierella polycephala]
MAPPLLSVAIHLRGAMSTIRSTHPHCLKRNPTALLFRLSHPTAASASASASYRFSILSTASSHTTSLAQDDLSLFKGSNQYYQLNTKNHISGNPQGLSPSTSETDASSSSPKTGAAAAVAEPATTIDSADRSKYNKPQFTPEMDRELLQLREQGHPWTTIGSIMGVPYRSCHRRYNTALDPQLHELWSQRTIERMDELVAQGKSWSDIAQDLGIRSSSCQIKWKALAKPKGMERNRLFDSLQSRVLLQLVEEHGEDNWSVVMRGFMMKLGGKDMSKVTPEQLRHQYYRLQRKSTHVWSLKEETALIQHVLKHGTGEWENISQALRRHTPEQCKEKWTSLDMSTKKPKNKAWYRAERSNFWRLWQRFGTDWDTIANSLPKRRPIECEAFFNKATAKFSKDDPELFQKHVQDLADDLAQYKSHAWKKEDSKRLLVVSDQCRSKSGRVNWDKVEKAMDLNLSASQYKHHHHYLMTIRRGGLSGQWTEDEVRILEGAVMKHGKKWVLISKTYLPSRNPKSVCHKFNMIQHKGNYKSEEEYDALMSKVDLQEQEFNRRQEKSGRPTLSVTFKPNWHEVARSMPGGTWTAEQCQSAYESSFKNHLKHAQWTAEQDKVLLAATRTMGCRNWIGVAKEVPGKDTWECRLRWSELQKPVLETMATTTDPVEAESISA